MSPADTKRCGTKRRKNKRGGLVPSNLAGVFEVKSVGPSSNIAPSCSSFSSSTPSTSTVAFLQSPSTNIASSSIENSLLAVVAPAPNLISSERMKNAEFQKKRCGGTINSSQTCKRNTVLNTDPETASQEPIDVEVNTSEEVVDLTCESSEPIVVDLTHNDSVVIVEENVCQPQNQEFRNQLPDSCILSSDDDEPRDEVILTSTLTKELELLEDDVPSSHRSDDTMKISLNLPKIQVTFMIISFTDIPEWHVLFAQFSQIFLLSATTADVQASVAHPCPKLPITFSHYFLSNIDIHS